MALVHRIERRRQSPEEWMAYLLSKRNISKSGCWEWTGGHHARGYGLVRAGAPEGTRLATVSVHRLAAHLWSGFPMDSPLQIMHKCDNPACFNPEHLMPGTQSDNIKDAVSKGRPHMAYLRKTQTHCKHGHEFTPENTAIRDGRRGCKQCSRDAAMRHYYEHKAP